MFDVREVNWPRVAVLEGRVAEIAGQLNALNGELAELVAELHGLNGCGDLSPRRWVAWQLGCSSTAAAVAAVAERISDLPVTLGALKDAEVSVDQAACIARHAPASADAKVRGFARFMTVPQLSRVCRADPHFDDQQDDEAGWRPEREQVSAGFDEAGWWQLRARLDADRGAIVDGALSHHYHALVADRPGPDAELPSLGDALVRMAQHSLTGTDRSGSAQVVVHVDAGGTVRLHQGPVLDARLAGLVCCDSVVQAQHEQDRRALAVGRRSRTGPLRCGVAWSTATGGVGCRGAPSGWDPLESTCRHASLSIL